MHLQRFILLVKTLAVGSMLVASGNTIAASKKPNILMIMSDDVGITNLSGYSRGMAGYHTPNYRPHCH